MSTTLTAEAARAAAETHGREVLPPEDQAIGALGDEGHPAVPTPGSAA